MLFSRSRESSAAGSVRGADFTGESLKILGMAPLGAQQRSHMVVVVRAVLASARVAARLARGNPSAPVIELGGQIMVGFSPMAIDQAIEAARNAKPL
jgi:hypothetical protein